MIPFYISSQQLIQTLSPFYMPVTLLLFTFSANLNPQEFSQLKIFTPQNAFCFSHHILLVLEELHISEVNITLEPISSLSIQRGSLPLADNLGDFYLLKQKLCIPSLSLVSRQWTLFFPPFHQQTSLLTMIKYLLPMIWLLSQRLLKARLC